MILAVSIDFRFAILFHTFLFSLESIDSEQLCQSEELMNQLFLSQLLEILFDKSLTWSKK